MLGAVERERKTQSVRRMELFFREIPIGVTLIFLFKSRRFKQPMFSIRIAQLIRNATGGRARLLTRGDSPAETFLPSR
jgi:hypothetical protein